MEDHREQQEEKKPEPKPVNFKENIRLLVAAFEKAKIINKYEVKEKSYPTDLNLFFNNGREMLKNPTLVRYIARAEKQIVEENQSAVISRAESMIKNDLNEIKEMLG